VEEEVEDEGIGKAADGEDEVVFPALLLVRVKRLLNHSPMFSNALGVTWPMVKLASHDAEVVIPTALARMLVCIISTGLYSQIDPRRSNFTHYTQRERVQA